MSRVFIQDLWLRDADDGTRPSAAAQTQPVQCEGSHEGQRARQVAHRTLRARQPVALPMVHARRRQARGQDEKLQVIG
mgnify:CR=1 FL=1